MLARNLIAESPFAYRELVQLCAVGEAYWRLTDAAKAAEYVVAPAVAVVA